MDINAAIAELLALIDVPDGTREDLDRDTVEIIERSHAIVGWLRRGGFSPSGESAERGLAIARTVADYVPLASAE